MTVWMWTEAKTNMRREKGLCDKWICGNVVLILAFFFSARIIQPVLSKSANLKRLLSIFPKFHLSLFLQLQLHKITYLLGLIFDVYRVYKNNWTNKMVR